MPEPTNHVAEYPDAPKSADELLKVSVLDMPCCMTMISGLGPNELLNTAMAFGHRFIELEGTDLTVTVARGNYARLAAAALETLRRWECGELQPEVA